MLAAVHQPLSHSAALSVLADQLGALDVALQEELAHAGVLTVRLPCEAEVWIGLDQSKRKPRSDTSFKVLVVLEPPDVQDRLSLGAFDLVLTWRRGQLEAFPSICRLFVPATPWLVPDEWSSDCAAKRSGLGFLRGSKRKTGGHQLRHEVWDARHLMAENIKIPLDFEEGGGVGRDVRNRQFSNQFVLVIENSRHENYFTEKLLDALLSRSVPVYWGCPNVSAFFDAAGLIEVEVGDSATGVAALERACVELTEEDYARRSEAVERNFELAKKYAGDFGQRVQRAIEAHLPAPHLPAAASEAPA